MHTNLDPKSLLRDERITVYFLPSLIFIASGVLSHMLISIYWGSLMNKFKQSTMARYLLISTAIVSWSMFVVLLLQYIIVIQYMDHIIDVDSTLRAYRDFFKAQTTSGYVQLALFIFSFFISLLACCVRYYYKLHWRGPSTTEAALQDTQFMDPTLGAYMYFFRAKKISGYIQWVLFISCRLCSRTFSQKRMLIVMILGYTSCVQMTSVFAFHCALYFFVNPLYTIIRVITTVVAFTLPILFIAMLLFAADYCKNWRQCEHVCSNMVDCKRLSFLFLIYTIAFSILLYINNLFAKGVKGLVAESLLSSGVLMTTIIASIVVTMLGYLTKKIIYRKFFNRIDLQLQQNPV